MADWAKPTITSDYVLFVDEVKNRDIDAITLQANPLTNPPYQSIRIARGTTIRFQEWDGVAFQERPISVEGGGTGTNSIAGIRANLGLGSMAYQNSNAISVSGGSIANITSGGSYFNHQGGTMTILTPTIAGHALTVNAPSNGYHGIIINGAVHGMHIACGSDQNQWPLRILNAASNLEILRVTGEGSVWIPTRMAIPVGADRWVTW